MRGARLIGFLGWVWITTALAEAVDPHRLKAAYIYKFASFAEWPRPPQEHFKVCILGRDNFGASLDDLGEKRIHSMPGQLMQLSVAGEAKHCQVVFLNPSNRSELKKWLDECEGLPILTISDHADSFEEGVIIALTTEPNRIGFRINMGIARQRGIYLPAQVLRLADEVR